MLKLIKEQYYIIDNKFNFNLSNVIIRMKFISLDVRCFVIFWELDIPTRIGIVENTLHSLGIVLINIKCKF